LDILAFGEFISEIDGSSSFVSLRLLSWGDEVPEESHPGMFVMRGRKLRSYLCDSVAYIVG
jgi:hypothetical protein